MADDMIREKAAMLFRKYGLIRDIPSSQSSAAPPQKPQFKKDFLAQVKSAARDMAETRRSESIVILADIEDRIKKARVSGNRAEEIRLEQERAELKRKLHIDS